jgi:hypothetical protein
MAREQGKAGAGGEKTGTGGNRPKPSSSPGAKQSQGTKPSGQSAKERSKAQSRPVSAKAPSGRAASASGNGRGSGGGGGNRPRPGGRPPAPAPGRRISGALWAWIGVGVVVVVVAVLVIVNVTSNSSNNLSYTPTVTAPASVVHDVTTIPASVFNQVGVTSPTIQVAPPTVSNGNPPLTLNGKAPSMLYYGAEYCPFCAAERWGMVAALSRFGTWSGLKVTASSHTDVDPATNTFSFYKATLDSPSINFVPIETYTNIPISGGGYTTLQTPTKEEAKAIATYSSSKYVPNASSAGGVSFPFIDIDNRVIISGASYDPGALANLSWSEIASGLSDPSNPATQAIVATANYISASICAVSPNAPSSVCKSPGVEAASKALKLS